MDLKEIQKHFDLYSNMYRALSNVAAALPIHPKFIDKIAHYLDTSFLWVKEALTIASMAQQQEEAAKSALEQPGAQPEPQAEPVKVD